MNLPFDIDFEQASSFFKQLSGSLLEKFAQSSPTFAQLLSTAATMQSLSGSPLPPYEQMKKDLFGEDYKFKTINDISAPEDFNLKTLTESLHKISKQFQQAALSSTSYVAEQLESPSIEGLGNLEGLSYSVPENSFIDLNLARKNIEFSEIVRSLTVDQLKEQPVEIAKRLVAQFVEMYK